MFSIYFVSFSDIDSASYKIKYFLISNVRKRHISSRRSIHRLLHIMDFLEDNSTEYIPVAETPSTRLIKFVIFIIITPPALVCNGISVYYLTVDQTLRRTIHNHALLVLLIATLLCNLVEIPRVIDYLRVGIVFPQTEINCLLWQWCDCLLFGAVNVLMLWISLERYLLIFHGNLYRTARHRLLYHYLPLAMIIVYMHLFYAMAIFINPCEQLIDFSLPLCGFPCFMSQARISLYDFITHTWIPLILGILLDVLLIIRVIYRKRIGVQQQGAHQRRHHKMAIQVLSISSLYSILQGPYSAVLFVQLFVPLPISILYVQTIYFYYLFWLLTLLLPFVSIGCLPEVISKLRHRIITRVKRNPRVAPIITVALQNRTL